MTREQKIAKASRLKEEGRPLTEIARVVGVDAATARTWLLDIPWPTRICPACDKRFEPSHGNQKFCCGENERKRFHERTHPKHCVECGAKRQANASPGGRCQTCHLFHVAEQTEPKYRRVEELWAEGATLQEIADAIGTTRNAMSPLLHRLRERGYNLPYRRDVYGGRSKPRFPEQVAA